MVRFRSVPIVFLLVFLASCGDKRQALLPKSGGTPYEVLVSGSDREVVALVKRRLEMVEMPYLPHSEQLYNVSSVVEDGLGRVSSYARNVVQVRLDGNLPVPLRVRYAVNVNAKPQLLIVLETVSAEALSEHLEEKMRLINQLVANRERKAEVERLEGARQPRARNVIKKMFGCDLRLPSEFNSLKVARNFVWVSDDGASAMRNICVYTLPKMPQQNAEMIEMRDSVMRRNIKGETAEMFMRTDAASVALRCSKAKCRRELETRGLWRMENDAMGGPFVSRALRDSVHGNVLVVEAFLYAPSMNKAKIMKQLEAVLYTLAATDDKI